MPSEKRQRQRENSQARQQAVAAAYQQSRRRRQITIALVLIVLFGGAIFWATRGGGDDTKLTSGTTTSTSVAPRKGNAEECPPAKGTKRRFTMFDQAPTMCIDAAKKYTAAIKTDIGTITIDLNTESAPNTVNNFVFLARNHYYDGIIFHRVIPDFMDQTGDPAGGAPGSPFPGYQFEDEIPEGYTYSEGDVAMANSGANTNGSQFFLVASDAGAETLLSAVGGVPKYTPFARVTNGMSVVKKINKDGSGAGKPNVEHRMISVTITEE